MFCGKAVFLTGFMLIVHPVTTNSYLVLDELLLPHMKKIDSMLNDNRKRLLLNLHLDQSFKVFPSHGLSANSVAIIVLDITGKNILEAILSFIKLSTHTVCSNLEVQENKICHCLQFSSFYLPCSDGTGCRVLHFLNVEF